MQLDPNHLVMLAAVVDEGGLTSGAHALGKSQPSLSRTLAALEARLGQPLFEKGGARLSRPSWAQRSPRKDVSSNRRARKPRPRRTSISGARPERCV
ncbi:MAG: LysR family transcriptional regulator, partial [Tateyamaria sp.]